MRFDSRGFGAIFLGAAFGLLHCGSSSDLGTPSAGSDGGVIGDGGHPPIGEVPLEHFAPGATCRSTRPAGINEDAGAAPCDADSGVFCPCHFDSECTAGNNGRCIVNGNAGPHCSYDACFAASDCATGSSCACGDIDSTSYNTCVQSNCRVDTDCGANGYCSPSYGTCGKFGGEYSGVYCHTPQDDCINDSDCTSGGGGSPTNGACIFSTDVAKWTCSFSVCAG